MPLPIWKCNLSAIDIPSIADALRVMKVEISNATQLLSKLIEASISLEGMIRESNFVEIDANYEATSLKQSAHNFELSISDIQERITSLEVVLSRKVVIPATFSTANDISVAFHLAVNSTNINWPLAEMVLETFFSIGNSFTGQDVWGKNNFIGNVAKLLHGINCWQVRKSLGLITNLIKRSSDIAVGPEMFDALASILVALPDDEEMKWAYLIAKNQGWNIDRGILTLINAFIYSRNGNTTIRLNALEIIHALIEEIEQRGLDKNIEHFLNSLNIFSSFGKDSYQRKGKYRCSRDLS